jgi:hypothetical protein
MDRAYKRLSKSDIIVTPFTANKQWNVLSSSLSSSNINVYKGVSGSLYDYTTTYDDQYQTLVYKSAEQLYYRNYTTYVSESNYSSSFFVNNGLIATQSLQSGQYWNYPQSTTHEIRQFPTESGATIWTVGIPRDLYGSKIKPGTFLMTSSFDYAVTEDGKGNLYLLDSSSLLTWDKWDSTWDLADYEWDNLPTSSNFSIKRVGNIIYPHGMLVFTTHSLECELFLTHQYGEYDVKFKNEHIIYENTVKCTVRESEFNYTHNPSISTDTSGSLRDFATGSGFTPYVTTVGLYNDSQELLAVAKMAQPIPLSTNTDTTFLINYDT